MALLFIVGIFLFALLAFFESNVYGIWYSIKSCLGRNGRDIETTRRSEWKPQSTETSSVEFVV
ncbi:hypothetical protein IscW_ISCW009527 [Ixodes scapularis]|uniref:Uncharacterized protein n=1 Tax=Ixodes scapularis TaxID=6945 RepID=B7Q2K3_IXOSC|nr:hypothetical protein IscW_ISCW009527 [Ixodes scapularis]|eukprot:XP_002410867.1 hypothetical protein IscW_ISCW009527 [Ixodes scapularis]